MENYQFIIDINKFESLSREVGYWNAQMNIKSYDEEGVEIYDEEAIEKYTELRDKQFDMMTELIEKYAK